MIYSHSNSALGKRFTNPHRRSSPDLPFAVFDVVRNVPDSILSRIAGTSKDYPPVKAPDVLISVTFAP